MSHGVYSNFAPSAESGMDAAMRRRWRLLRMKWGLNLGLGLGFGERGGEKEEGAS